VRKLNQTFAELTLSQHPDKTFIGRIEGGFDFLGYYYSRGPLRLAHRTLQKHVTRFHRLYEQQKTAPAGAVRLDEYVTRWSRWCRAGLGELLSAATCLGAPAVCPNRGLSMGCSAGFPHPETHANLIG
jgi:hypothetical protein